MLYASTTAYIDMCVNINIYIYIHTHIYMSIYICLYICIHVHTMQLNIFVGTYSISYIVVLHVHILQYLPIVHLVSFHTVILAAVFTC